MLKITQAIVVEGNYDKIKLSQIVDATIVVTDGFMIYKNAALQNMIKQLADRCGVIIFTDSDMAGFRIRTFIKNILCGKKVYHAYIPDIYGKEKRKKNPSKEGFLGVEGMEDEIIIQSLKDAIGKNIGNNECINSTKKVTKADLFSDGFSGCNNSAVYRKRLTDIMNLPHRISANMLIDVINSLYTYDEYKMIVDSVKSEIV